MSFGRLGSMGRGFGHLGALGGSSGSGAARLLIAANLTRGNYAADTTSAGNEAREQRSPHFLGRVAYSELWFRFSNWWLDLGAGGREVPTGNPVTVSHEAEINGIPFPARNGSLASPTSVADGADFDLGPYYPSDFGLSQFSAQSEIFCRMRAVVSPGQKIPRAGQYLSVSPASRLWLNAGDPSQLHGTGAFPGALNTNLGPTCTMIVGRQVSNEIALLEMGDSIGEGNSDTQQVLIGLGHFDRGAANVGGLYVPIAHGGRHGGQLSRLSNGTDGSRRRIWYRNATHIQFEYGANDLFFTTALNTYTAFQTNLLAEIVIARAAGVGFICVSKIVPRTQSSDQFLTSANQLTQYGTGGGPGVNGYWDTAQITTINNWIDGLKVAGTIDDVFDPLPIWTDAGDVTKWKTNGSTAWYPVTTNGDGNGALITATQYINGTHPSIALNITGGAQYATQVAGWPLRGGASPSPTSVPTFELLGF